ncbi:MAG: sensor histidine kinase [Anaerolineae bacterium]
MNNVMPTITSTSDREARLYDLGIAVILIVLFVFNVFTIQPPLTFMAFLVYALLTLVVVAECILTAYLEAGHKFRLRDRIRWSITIDVAEMVMLFAVVLILRGRARPYFYLAALNGYGTFGIETGKYRWAVAWVIGVMALGWLSYAVLWGWQSAWLTLLGDLPWYGFAVAFTEFYLRQWEQREHTEVLAAELAEAHRQLQDYAAQAEALAVAQERARLAHEIHDTMGHTLTALDVQLELLARLPPGQTEQRRQAAKQTRALVKTGLADVRRAVKALRPAALETFSLPEAIAALVADFERTTHIRTAWQVEGEVAPLPARLALPLYRAAQEALTNVQRHAPAAQQVTLQLHYGPEAVALSVENDGVPPSLMRETSEVSEDLGGLAQEGRGGYGLRGLRERAEALRGAFSAGPDEAGGFRVEMSLPVISEQRSVIGIRRSLITGY